MVNPSSIDLVYFTGCPHVEHARTALREALVASGLPPDWREWDQLDPGTPAHLQGYASPTILVAGCDVTGNGRSEGSACRSDGVPSAEEIRAAINDQE